jgi:ribosomal protein L9
MITSAIATVTFAAYWFWSNIKTLLVGAVFAFAAYWVGYFVGGNSAYHHFKVKSLQAALSAYKQNVADWQNYAVTKDKMADAERQKYDQLQARYDDLHKATSDELSKLQSLNEQLEEARIAQDIQDGNGANSIVFDACDKWLRKLQRRHGVKVTARNTCRKKASQLSEVAGRGASRSLRKAKNSKSRK